MFNKSTSSGIVPAEWKLKVKKASGLDNLPFKFLKIGTDILT